MTQHVDFCFTAATTKQYLESYAVIPCRCKSASVGHSAESREAKQKQPTRANRGLAKQCQVNLMPHPGLFWARSKYLSETLLGPRKGSCKCLIGKDSCSWDTDKVFESPHKGCACVHACVCVYMLLCLRVYAHMCTYGRRSGLFKMLTLFILLSVAWLPPLLSTSNTEVSCCLLNSSCTGRLWQWF